MDDLRAPLSVSVLILMLASLTMVSSLPAAAAEGVACKTYSEVYTQGGNGTTETTQRDCPIFTNPGGGGGKIICVGYSEETVNHYNDPNEPSSTHKKASCQMWLPGEPIGRIWELAVE